MNLTTNLLKDFVNILLAHNSIQKKNKGLKITISLIELYIYCIMDFVELPFVKMSPRAVVPTKATKYSIGLDHHSPYNYLIHPKKQVLIPTQIKLGISPGYYGRIASKSHLAIQNQVHVGVGVIDPDYTGEIKVVD